MLLFVSLCLQAQKPSWTELRHQRLIEFDWNCTTTSAYPRAKLGRIVEDTIRRNDFRYKLWSDRAFAFDLNGDRRNEYFVPIVCGAVGNCTWGVFTVGPTKLIGLINGQFIYAPRRSGHYPILITYAHENSSDGALATYILRDSEYSKVGSYYYVSAVPGATPLPKFLKKAHPACKRIGY